MTMESMLTKNLIITLGLLTLAGCTTPLRTDIADAIDLCGSVAKLQAANVEHMGKMNSFIISGKAETKITYPELTPDLRASAIRSISHCVNLHLGKISPERYDKLMTLEATNAAAAEHALTSEQLADLIAKGYKKVADILRDAGVSAPAIAQLGQAPKAELSAGAEMEAPGNSPEMQALIALQTKLGTVDTALNGLPAEIVKVMTNGPKPRLQPTAPVATVLFAPGMATLDATALLTLHKSLPEFGPDAQLSVVGSADVSGDELRNMELSRKRAQAVAAWLLNNRQIDARRLHVAARGAQRKGEKLSADRSVTVFGP